MVARTNNKINYMMSDYILDKFEQNNIAIDEAYQTINPKVDFKGWLKKIECENKALDIKMKELSAKRKPSWSGGFSQLEDNITNPNPLDR